MEGDVKEYRNKLSTGFSLSIFITYAFVAALKVEKKKGVEPPEIPTVESKPASPEPEKISNFGLSFEPGSYFGEVYFIFNPSKITVHFNDVRSAQKVIRNY